MLVNVPFASVPCHLASAVAFGRGQPSASSPGGPVQPRRGRGQVAGCMTAGWRMYVGGAGDNRGWRETAGSDKG